MVRGRLVVEARAADLTRHLLAYSRRQPLEPKVVDVNRLIGQSVGLLKRTLGEHIEVETVLGDGIWLTLADPAQFESALINLAVNARDAMPGGGKLTIETANRHLDPEYAGLHDEVKKGHYVLVAVSDTGQGMTKEVLDRAFEPFFTTKEAGRGTGIHQGLAAIHQGRIDPGVQLVSKPWRRGDLARKLRAALQRDEPGPPAQA